MHRFTSRYEGRIGGRRQGHPHPGGMSPAQQRSGIRRDRGWKQRGPARDRTKNAELRYTRLGYGIWERWRDSLGRGRTSGGVTWRTLSNTRLLGNSRSRRHAAHTRRCAARRAVDLEQQQRHRAFALARIPTGSLRSEAQRTAIERASTPHHHSRSAIDCGIRLGGGTRVAS